MTLDAMSGLADCRAQADGRQPAYAVCSLTPRGAYPTRAQGRARVRQFVDQVARHARRGRSLGKAVREEIPPNRPLFFGPDGDAEETNLKKSMVRVAGVEPALLAEPDFEPF